MKKLYSAILSLTMLFATVSFTEVQVLAEEIPGNLYENGDFESGTVEPNVMRENTAVGKLVATDEQAHSGKYSVKVAERSNQAEAWGQRLTVEEGKTYIFAGYARLADDALNSSIPVNIYWFEGSKLITKIYTQSTQPWIGKSNWTFLIDVFTANEDGEIWPEIIGWNYGKGLDEYYVDDIYFGELALEEISMTSAKRVAIPFEGETRISLTASVLNQLGNDYGVSGVKYEWSMDNTDDIYVENNELVVKNTASEGTVTVNVTATIENGSFSDSFDIEIYKQDILDVTNLYVNGDLETGSVTPFTIRSGSNGNLSIEENEVYEGNYSLKIADRKNQADVWGQQLNVKEGKTYIFKGYGKLAQEAQNTSVPTEVYWFAGGNKITKNYTQSQQWLGKDNWTEIITIVTANEDTSVWPELIAWNYEKGVDNYFVDDLYFGELIVNETEIKVPKEINIPKSGENSEELSAKLYNQFGSSLGLENVDFQWIVKDDISGVRTEDNKLVVDNKAVAQNIELFLFCESPYSGEVIYQDIFNVELLPHDDENIYIENVTLLGTVKTGEELTLKYDYRQVNNEADASEIAWYIADSYEGEYKKIEGINGTSLEIISDYEGKFIKAGILPKSETGRTGKEVFSNIACEAMAPEARNIKIEGEMYIGNELKGSYEFFDANLDGQGGSKFQWLRKKPGESEFAEIAGATEISYTLTEEDRDALLKFSVTPVSENEPYEGLSYESTEMSGPTVPIAKNVKITSKGDVYTGSYEYYHPHGFFQGESVLEWYVDGELYGKGSSIVVEKANKEIVFKVTPVSEYAPFNGETVTAKTTSRKKSSGGGTSSGGGGYVRDVNPITPVVTVKTPVDMDNHWAKDTAVNIVNKGIMELDENNYFYPQAIITRAEMVEYICKALELDAVSYRDEFSDVISGDSFAGFLQSAVDAGIISKDINFRPNDNIKRCEFAKIIAVAAEINGISQKNEYTGFADEEIIPEWSREYIKTVVKTGMMIGNANGTFNPLGNITKAECATVLERIINMKGV